MGVSFPTLLQVQAHKGRIGTRSCSTCAARARGRSRGAHLRIFAAQAPATSAGLPSPRGAPERYALSTEPEDDAPRPTGAIGQDQGRGALPPDGECGK